MRILALETSSQAGSVALADRETPLAQQNLDANQRSAQSLVPAIHSLVTAAGWRIADIELVAVTIGPGSFTGLRVGVATAKTLAYALQARVVGINTLEVIAAQAICDRPRLSVAMDAGRGEVFSGEFERGTDAISTPTSGSIVRSNAHSDPRPATPQWRMSGSPRIVASDAWLAGLPPDTAVSGHALEKLQVRLPPGAVVVESSQWAPRAATVAALAWRRHLAGQYDDVWKLAPLYLRRSAAEEKWESRQGAQGYPEAQTKPRPSGRG